MGNSCLFWECPFYILFTSSGQPIFRILNFNFPNLRCCKVFFTFKCKELYWHFLIELWCNLKPGITTEKINKQQIRCKYSEFVIGCLMSWTSWYDISTCVQKSDLNCFMLSKKGLFSILFEIVYAFILIAFKRLLSIMNRKTCQLKHLAFFRVAQVIFQLTFQLKHFNDMFSILAHRNTRSNFFFHLSKLFVHKQMDLPSLQ